MVKYCKTTMVILSACLMSLTSCTSMAPGSRVQAPGIVKSKYPLSEARADGYWWSCRFKITWPPGVDPDFTVDVFLAHAVVKPILTEYENRMVCWRFHRRAAPDKAGHQFSFFFYSDSATAKEVFGKIEQSSPLIEALTARIVETVTMDDPGKPSRPGIQDLSDPNWSQSLQRSWPPFIMGVCSLWLGLINDAISDVPGESNEIHGALKRYREANNRVTSIWYKEGQHAFLHHLNAIFGYEPLLLRKEIRF